MSRSKFHVKKGDLVRVITGDYKGVEGVILKMLTKKERVHVEGVAKLKKAVRPSQKNPQGGFTEIDRPIHVSNVQKIETEKKPAAKKVASKKKPVSKKN